MKKKSELRSRLPKTWKREERNDVQKKTFSIPFASQF